MPPSLFFFLKIAFIIQNLSNFHADSKIIANSKIICSSSVKNIIGILIDIALSLYISLGSIHFFIYFPIFLSVHPRHAWYHHLCPRGEQCWRKRAV